MTKKSGLGDHLYWHGVNISTDVQQVGAIRGGPVALDMTGINKSAYERKGGLRDGAMELTAFFNPTALETHDRLSVLPSTDVIVSYWKGTGVGAAVANCVAKQVDYAPTRAADGMFTFGVPHVSNGYGLEWGEALTTGATAGGHQDYTTTGNGASIDNGAATAFGAQMYIHLISFTGTLVSVNVQGSSDNGAGDAFANITGLAAPIGPGAAPAAYRYATSATEAIERYLRLSITGVFTQMTIAASVVRNQSAPAF